MGINVSLYKSLTFGVSALYTGVAGALGAIAIAFVAPDSFTFVLAVALFVGLVVGGVGSIPGTIAGGFFILFVPNIAESVSKGLAGAVYGVHPAAGDLRDAVGRGGTGAPDHGEIGTTKPLGHSPNKRRLHARRKPCRCRSVR